MPRCIFHIDLDAFFVSVEQALHPELRGKPVIVGGDLCPQAIFIIANFPHYRDASARFMEILAHFCPNIEPLGLDEGYLDVTECLALNLFQGDSPRKLALSIKERIHKELNLTASVGIATCNPIETMKRRFGSAHPINWATTISFLPTLRPPIFSA